MSETVGVAAVEESRTGDEVVDAALAHLAALPVEAPVEEHVRVLDEVHEALRHHLSATQG